MRSRSYILLAVGTVLVLSVLACTAEQRELLERLGPDPNREDAAVASPTAVAQAPTANPTATETPAFSELKLPTAIPTMGGPMGTLTAIADLVATDEPDRTPYVIVNRGQPHFIEFHAWW